MNSVLAWMVTYLVHSTILVLGAWLLERKWRDRPERMSAVWKTALVGGVVTASLQMVLGISPAAGQWDLETQANDASVAVLTTGAEAVAAPVAEPTPVPVVVSTPHDVALVWSDAGPSPHPAAVVVPSTAPVAIAVNQVDRDETATVAPVAAPPSGPSTASLLSSATPWIVTVISLGAILGLFSVIAAFVALRRQLHDRQPLREGVLPVLLERLRARAGIGRRVPLTLAPRLRIPMAVGVVQPEIVVPTQAAAELSAEHQESLLAHELAHVLRRDPAWRLVGLLAERVLFFQPLNRLASSRVAQAAEYLCDDWAARHTRQPLALASCLTEIAAWVSTPSPVGATMSGPRSILGRRVHRLLAPPRVPPRPRWLALVLAIPLLLVVFAAPGVSAQTEGDHARVVVVDGDGNRRSLSANDEGVIVLSSADGVAQVWEMGDQGAHGEPLTRKQARKLAREHDKAQRDADRRVRKQQRKADKDLREARKRLRKTVRQAKRNGEPAPTRAEALAILRGHSGSSGHVVVPNSQGDHFELHLVVPGEMELHGHVPVGPEAMKGFEALGELEALEALEAIEALGEIEGLEELHELEPVLEFFEGLEQGDVEFTFEDDDGGTLHLELHSSGDADGPQAHGHHRRSGDRVSQHVGRRQQQVQREMERRQHAVQREQHAAMREAQRLAQQFQREAQREAHRRARVLERAAHERAQQHQHGARRVEREQLERKREKIERKRENVERARRAYERAVEQGRVAPEPGMPHVRRVAPPSPPRVPSNLHPAPAAPRSPVHVRRFPFATPRPPSAPVAPRGGAVAPPPRPATVATPVPVPRPAAVPRPAVVSRPEGDCASTGRVATVARG